MPKVSSPANPSSTPVDAVPTSYEAALLELEQLVGQLESGQMPLDQLLSGYQRGASLLAFCRERLSVVEAQIKLLDDGVLKPWEQA